MAYSGTIQVSGIAEIFSAIIRFVCGDPSTPGRNWQIIFTELDTSPNNFSYISYSGTLTVNQADTWYDLPTAFVTEYTFTYGGNTLVEKTDYQLDWTLGRIKILSGGSVSSFPANIGYSYKFKRYRIVLKNEYWIAGGPIGLKNIPSAFPLKNSSYEIFLILNLFLVIGILLSFHLILKIIINSPYGRILKAIREDETLTQILGKNTFKYKAQVFIIGSAMAGAAGSFLSQYIGYVSTDLFLSTTTFTIWIMCIIGGPSNINGAIIGAFIMRGIERGTRILKDYANIPIDPNNFMFIITGILMVLFIMYKPDGIMKERRMKVE